MNLVKTFKKLCMPSALYFVLAILSLILLVFQNMNNSHTLCVGNYSCPVPNVTLVFVINLVYIIFWTWVLNLICKAGWNWLSWFLVLFPFIVISLFVLLGMTAI